MQFHALNTNGDLLIALFQPDVSLIIAIGAGADLLSRVFLAISSTCLNIKARYVYLAGALFTILARFGNYLYPLEILIKKKVPHCFEETIC